MIAPYAVPHLFAVYNPDRPRNLGLNVVRNPMLFFERLVTSCVLFAILSLALLITIGMVAGARGGINSPTGRDSRAYAAGYEVTRRYGAIVLLSVLSVLTLAAVAISFTGVLPWCRRECRPPPRPKV
jgi:hypothetical protein